jgi:hypothetical protein
MKLFYSFAIVMAMFAINSLESNAQFLQLSARSSNTNITNGSYMVFYNVAYVEEEFSVRVKNVSNETKDIRVVREQLQRVNGSVDYYCWNLCFDTLTNVSGFISLSAGQTDSTSFHSTYRSNGNNGESIIKFRFSSSQSAADSVNFTVHFIATPASVADFSPQAEIQNLFPNPAQNQINLNTNSSFSNGQNFAQISDLSGRLIQTSTIQPGLNAISTEDLSDGIYFMQLFLDGKPGKPSKFIVKH